MIGHPIFVFAAKLDISEGNIFKKLLIGAFVLILSIVSYYSIEKPFREKKIKFKKIFIFLFLKLLLIL
jgi:peptidoglycan/LPS O-acetylase OafA/YrhL